MVVVSSVRPFLCWPGEAEVSGVRRLPRCSSWWGRPLAGRPTCGPATLLDDKAQWLAVRPLQQVVVSFKSLDKFSADADADADACCERRPDPTNSSLPLPLRALASCPRRRPSATSSDCRARRCLPRPRRRSSQTVASASTGPHSAILHHVPASRHQLPRGACKCVQPPPAHPPCSMGLLVANSSSQGEKRRTPPVNAADCHHPSKHEVRAS